MFATGVYFNLYYFTNLTWLYQIIQANPNQYGDKSAINSSAASFGGILVSVSAEIKNDGIFVLITTL